VRRLGGQEAPDIVGSFRLIRAGARKRSDPLTGTGCDTQEPVATGNMTMRPEKSFELTMSAATMTLTVKDNTASSNCVNGLVEAATRQHWARRNEERSKTNSKVSNLALFSINLSAQAGLPRLLHAIYRKVQYQRKPALCPNWKAAET